ncbi:hypothetical protein DPEC_G00147970 [Dallia pectoralis]|uniref:Uncharacterized protein n=1 Tax=Dallia pectoralis TaxID=75939 RepID=A0ACC2GI49_DALPE|nr:hypothetical protein DPEC_G00147970 [Dallia pectoralis]
MHFPSHWFQTFISISLPRPLTNRNRYEDPANQLDYSLLKALNAAQNSRHFRYHSLSLCLLASYPESYPLMVMYSNQIDGKYVINPNDYLYFLQRCKSA